MGAADGEEELADTRSAPTGLSRGGGGELGALAGWRGWRTGGNGPPPPPDSLPPPVATRPPTTSHRLPAPSQGCSCGGRMPSPLTAALRRLSAKIPRRSLCS